MRTRWTAEQVLSLAPDASSKSAARALSTPAPWSDTGTVESLVWGRCRGSGSKRYQTVVDLAGPAYQCTCPSRKSPCKHALGLLLLWAADGVPGLAEPGDFAAVWADSRENRAAAADRATRVAAPKDPEQAARTAARRHQRVTQGLAELDVWLRDQVRTGIAGASADAYRRFDGMAARMVDAQAPGAAATLRRLPQVTSSGPGWPGRLLAELAQLRLLVAAHERLGELPDLLAATVRSRIGYTVSAEEVLTTAPVRDLWHVLGSTEADSGSLVTRRTWLLAAAADRPALVLSFGAGGQQPDRSLVGGTALDADLHFYPGQPPLRALVGQQYAEAQTPPRITSAPRPRTVARLLDDHAAARAQDPWLTVWPALLDVRPARGGGHWRLLDEGGDSLPMRAHRESLWPVLATSGGDVVTVAAEFSDGWLYPVGVWPRQGYASAAAGGSPAVAS
ncbi:MAG TPA: SWIM zinc finger family protein [Lapillicoccus sp.]